MALQVATLLINLAGVAYVVDAASTGYTNFAKSVRISTFWPLMHRTSPLIGLHGEQSKPASGPSAIYMMMMIAIQLSYFVIVPCVAAEFSAKKLHYNNP